jgi:uncharacterized tellurite resistance protein B-like protein
MVFVENLKILVNLALVDGNMSEKEKTCIKNIAKAHGFPESSAETLFYSSHDIIIPQPLTPDQKFEYAYTLIQLMKIDEQLFQDEIKFTAGVIEKLGYRPEVIAELLLKVDKGPMEASQKEELKRLTASYLISR